MITSLHEACQRQVLCTAATLGDGLLAILIALIELLLHLHSKQHDSHSVTTHVWQPADAHMCRLHVAAPHSACQLSHSTRAEP